MAIQISQLNGRLTFEKSVAVENENGVPTPAWEPVCTIWGGARDVSGKEYFEAAAQQMENITTFTIRWRDGLDTAMRIIFRGEAYEIVQINRLGYRGDYMQIKARRQGGEGA